MPTLFLALLLAGGGPGDSDPDPDPEPAFLYRHHGPSAIGGISVESAKIIAPGAMLLSFKTDLTFFERLDSTDIMKRTIEHGDDPAHFDMLRSSQTEIATFKYG